MLTTMPQCHTHRCLIHNQRRLLFSALLYFNGVSGDCKLKIQVILKSDEKTRFSEFRQAIIKAGKKER